MQGRLQQQKHGRGLDAVVAVEFEEMEILP